MSCHPEKGIRLKKSVGRVSCNEWGMASEISGLAEILIKSKAIKQFSVRSCEPGM